MKQKILFFAHSLSIGGAERVMVNLLKIIDLEKYDVSLCLLSNTGEYFDEIPKQIKIVSIFNSNFIARSIIFTKRTFNISFPLKIATKWAVREQYDVGISFSDGQLTDVMLLLKNNFRKKIAWVHSCYISESAFNKFFTPQNIKLLNQKRYNLLDHVVFVSENAKVEFEELFGNIKKGQVIHNIIDFETIILKSKECLDLAFDKNIINIIAIGRLVEVKEYPKLIAAAGILVKKHLKFKIRIVGDGVLMNQLKVQVVKLNLHHYIEFTGFISNPYPYLEQSDILVVSSSSEALPTILFEAMILKVPIVATNCSGAIEITQNGKYGLIANQSVEDIAAKLEIMIKDDHLREHYTEQGLIRLESFSEEKNMEKICKIFE